MLFYLILATSLLINQVESDTLNKTATMFEAHNKVFRVSVCAASAPSWDTWEAVTSIYTPNSLRGQSSIQASIYASK